MTDHTKSTLLPSCAFVVSAWLLANSYQTAAVYERPIHSLVVVFALTACALLNLEKFVPASYRRALSDVKYETIPLEDHPQFRPRSSSFRDGVQEVPALRPRTLKILLLLGTGVLAGRIDIYRRVSRATECTTRSPEVVLPLLYAFYDAIRLQKSRIRNAEDVVDKTAYDLYYERFILHCFKVRWRYIPATTALVIGLYGLSCLNNGLHSTYICPISLGLNQQISRLQWLGAFLDSTLLLLLAELLTVDHGLGQSRRSRSQSILAFILVGSSILWTATGLTVFTLQPETRDWLLYISFSYGVSIVWHSILFTILCATACLTIPRIGMLSSLFNLSIAISMIPSIQFIWRTRKPFPPTPWAFSILPFLLIFAGHVTFTKIKEELEPKTRLLALANGYVKMLVLTLSISPAFFKTGTVPYHPINMLIYQAKAQHEDFTKYVTQSHSLEDADAQYRRRYTRNPPPAFDKWYRFAVDRNSTIIDQYNQIYDDVLPFWSIEPAEIRRLTWELISNPWTDVAGISIRNGSASIHENVVPTHKWMLEGVAAMINRFAEFLPDMDLAFNINDEARIAVPYSEITSLKTQARDREHANANQVWLPDRSSDWAPLPNEPLTDHSLFTHLSFQNTFSTFGSLSCPASSPARTRAVSGLDHSYIDYRSSQPHSLGQFLSNWTLSASVCHQPDLAHLHGFFLSPAAFKGSHKLLPVFSQSKPHGWNDVLYPSAWNYIDKVAYQPDDDANANPDLPFKRKQSTLFWRGATSEGMSPGTGTWRGMARQRLVHLANNLTMSSHDQVTILVQDPFRRTGYYHYMNVPGPALSSLGLNTDIKIVDQIVRCGGRPPHSDCQDQEAEFGLVGPSDFQSHWKYKYLFDLDGAGFSGRFLPFLQSHSLPFKTALFREWYDDRLTAWWHFVPQDLRLHDVFSTLAYFVGVNGKDPRSGRELFLGAHDQEAELIAENGRKWANQVLRKEDMEVYFFRLLLEWGRVVDDRREELGFSSMRHGVGSLELAELQKEKGSG